MALTNEDRLEIQRMIEIEITKRIGNVAVASSVGYSVVAEFPVGLDQLQNGAIVPSRKLAPGDFGNHKK